MNVSTLSFVPAGMHSLLEESLSVIDQSAVIRFCENFLLLESCSSKEITFWGGLLGFCEKSKLQVIVHSLGYVLT